MRRMPLGGLLAALLVFAPLGCGTGPAPKPLSQPEPTSAEATARAAAESARENDEGLIYASSEDPYSEATLKVDGETGDGEPDSEGTSVAELRLSFDAQGGLLIGGKPAEMVREAPVPEAPVADDDTEAASSEEASPDAASPVAGSLDALTLAISDAIEALEPASRLRIIIEPPEVPQRMDQLFAAIGTVVANPPVPVEIHIVPAR